MKQNIVIIPARGGSKEIPGKNIKPLGGKPLLAYSIEAAKFSQKIDRVIVSTDSKEIAVVSQKYGAEIIMRPQALATDSSPSEDALIHAVESLESNEKVQVDLIVFLQATSPLRPPELIDQCIDKLIENDGDSLLTVCSEHLFYWRESNGLGESIHNYRNRPMRQLASKSDIIYKENSSLYIMKRDILIKQKNRLGRKIILFPMEVEDSFEIDSKFDFWLIEKVMEWKAQKHLGQMNSQ
jgi:N-acylneuraminate cytidylyltransferase